MMTTIRSLTCTLLVSSFCFLLPVPAMALTQQDWMVTLVDALGRSFGLPDRPQSSDYDNILSGKRNFRFEAEAVHSPDDEVAVMAFANYGTFSGAGWLLAAGTPTDVHLRFLLPLDGSYRLALALRGTGALVRTSGGDFTADGDPLKLTRVELGSAELAAGAQEITVTLPPGGALDYLDLSAPNLEPIVPDGGWQPSVVLDWKTLATTSITALGSARELPATTPVIAIEAEDLAEKAGASVVADTHLGPASGGLWLRAGADGAHLTVPVATPSGGFFDLSVSSLGTPVRIQLNNLQELILEGQPFLDASTQGPFLLNTGSNRIDITLPPGGGLDRVVLIPRRSDLPTLTAALGMTGVGDIPTSADIDTLTSRLTVTLSNR